MSARIRRRTDDVSISVTPRPFDASLEWRAEDVRDPSAWTIELTASDHTAFDLALSAAKASARSITEITREEFPLNSFAQKLADIRWRLTDGHGFVLLRKLDPERYSADELTMLFWGIGVHLGDPWPQNKYGELITDVTDHGRNEWNPDRRDSELGGIALDHHTDGADLVGLLSLQTAQTGGVSCLANTVAIYNDLCRTRPDLVRALHEDLPFDFRGEELSGRRPYYMSPVFSVLSGRLFVRFIAEYIKTSQRHAEAPRLTPLAMEAIEALSAMATAPSYNVHMAFQAGDLQFINNHRVLHARTAYTDAPEIGLTRHLKRLWLGSDCVAERPRHFSGGIRHWERRRLSRAQPNSSRS